MIDDSMPTTSWPRFIKTMLVFALASSIIAGAIPYLAVSCGRLVRPRLKEVERKA